MDKLQAEKIIKAYNNAWVQNNVNDILYNLGKNCVIIESHGPMYSGIENIKKWLTKWNVENSNVNKWDITSFIYDNGRAVYEWDFSCTVHGVIYHLTGISVVTFDDRQIIHLQEYRMTQKVYEYFLEKVNGQGNTSGAINS